MERLGERVFCKVGAEGMYCAALPERGLGVAIKIDDGNTARAAEVVMAARSRRCVPLDDEDAAFMRALGDATLRNWNGIEVGALRATVELRQALRRSEGSRLALAQLLMRSWPEPPSAGAAQQRLQRLPRVGLVQRLVVAHAAACAGSAPRCRSCAGRCG